MFAAISMMEAAVAAEVAKAATVWGAGQAWQQGRCSRGGSRERRTNGIGDCRLMLQSMPSSFRPSLPSSISGGVE